jgi:predicted ATPase/DNA-binding SARP family transcriptional activator/Tfp pilus assembly protein PilF
MTVLRLTLFGAFQATTAVEETRMAEAAQPSSLTEPLSFRSDKIRALLAYLAVENGRPHSRDSLAALLWPEFTDTAALHNLRNSLYRLRKEFGAGVGDKILTVDRQNVLLQTRSLWLDVARFRHLLDDCAGHQHHARQNCPECIERLQKAADLYQGEFLAGFSLPDALPYDEWLLVHRERFHQQTLAALYDLSRYYTNQGQYALARKFASRQIKLEPWNEAGHRQMMRALAMSGRLEDALAQYESCRQTLARELGAEPAAETAVLYQQIRDNQAAGQSSLPPIAAQEPPKGAPASNLPRQFTQFVGRRAEVSAIIERLDNPDCALLTITGPGGIGKTRLVIEAARQQIGRYEDGVWFVSLVPVQAVEDVPAAIAAGLPLPPFSSGDIERQVLTYLSSRQALLIIDNFEHLLGGADFLSSLLQQAPGVKILATSRERLNLKAEWVFDIQGLSIPSTEKQEPLLENYAAIQLFIQQLHQHRRSMVLTEEDIEQIGRICSLVEGVPLAIELAINLTATRSLNNIADLVTKDLDTLKTHSRDVPERQRSLRAVFDHSWHLLHERERKGLRNIAVFPASFTMEAAVKVAETSEASLRSLVEKSFLRRNENGRFEMHVLLRQFANEKLSTVAPRAIQRLKERFNSYYLSLLQSQETVLDSPTGSAGVEKLHPEIDNFRLAWQTIVSRPDIPAIAQSAPALVAYFSLSGHSREAERLLQKAIAALGPLSAEGVRGEGLPPEEMEKYRLASYLLTQQIRFFVKLAMSDEAIAAIKSVIQYSQITADIDARLEARSYWGTILWRQGRYEEAREQSDIALQLRKNAHNDLLKIRVLVQRGIIQNFMGDFDKARQYYFQALEQYQLAGIDGLPRIAIYVNLASLALTEGKYRQAGEQFEQALHDYRQIGSYFGEAIVLDGLSSVAFHEQRYKAALTLGQQALSIYQELGEVVREGGVLLTLGRTFTRLGQWERARTLLERALTLTRQIRNQNLESEALLSLCSVACQLGAIQQALQLSRQALPLAEKSFDRDLYALALTSYGRTLAGAGQMEEAVECYMASLTIRRELKQPHLTVEIEALLAHLYLKQNDLAQAVASIDRVMAYLQLSNEQKGNRPFLPPPSNSQTIPIIRQLKGVQDPFRVYLDCYHVLQAKGDDRGTAVLDFAADLLQEQANLLDDAELEKSFLENVPVNRQILAYNLQVGLESKSLE